MPHLAAARAAARISSGADMVSIQATSAPPSRRPSICSMKTSTASSSLNGPSGARRSPVGPTDPATTTGRPALSATSARELGGEPVEFARARFEAVQHEAAAVGPEAVGQDDVGAGVDEGPMQALDRVRMVGVPELGESPAVRPMAKRLVPVAPSASSGRPSARRDCNMSSSLAGGLRVHGYLASWRLGARSGRSGNSRRPERTPYLCVTAFLPAGVIFFRGLRPRLVPRVIFGRFRLITLFLCYI